MTSDSERGSATIGLLAAMLAALLLGAAVAVMSSAMVAKRRAAAAADLGALAGAQLASRGRVPACQRAAAVVSANGAQLTDCSLHIREVAVAVEIAMPGGVGTVRTKARAGPVHPRP